MHPQRAGADSKSLVRSATVPCGTLTCAWGHSRFGLNAEFSIPLQRNDRTVSLPTRPMTVTSDDVAPNEPRLRLTRCGEQRLLLRSCRTVLAVSTAHASRRRVTSLASGSTPNIWVAWLCPARILAPSRCTDEWPPRPLFGARWPPRRNASVARGRSHPRPRSEPLRVRSRGL